MTTSNNPRILNLDDLELAQSDITIIHDGTEHRMRILTVDLFIEQNKRAMEHQKLVAKGLNNIEDDPEIGDVVALMRNSIGEFFPTLPVGELPTAKMFAVFAWLNDMSARLNSDGADTVEDTEGNATSPEIQTGG